jgi:DNA segregation ATPase FtsK/SpoIIIE-like protein
MLPAMVDKYLEKAELVARVVDTVLAARPGTDPALIERWVLTRTEGGAIWLFAVLDDRRLPKFEPYAAAVHHLSSSLRGMPVLLGNHTGLRYGILLSQRPQLPMSLDYPVWKRGVMQLGVDARGQAVEIGYGEITHTLVAGITQFGKSNLLRLMALQARDEGWQLALADPDGRTFTKFEGDLALVCPVGKTLESSVLVIGRVQELINERAKLYDQAGNSPDGLDEYNEWATANDVAALQPVMVVLDEFNGTVLATGGIRGSFASAATQIAWRAAKFGIRLVLAGQDFSKEIVGPVREQMTTRICLRVANERISDVVLGKTGAERLALPGRAMTNRWGTIQTYFVPKTSLVRKDANGLTTDEQKLAAFILEKYNGRMTMPALQDYGMSDRTARRVRADWNQRGLAEVRPDQDNALCLTVKMDVQAGLGGLGAVSTGPGAQGGLDGSGVEEA